MEAPVPSQVADRLRGRAFKDFDDFRHAFWQAAVAVPELASQFGAANVRLMSRGEAPKAPPAEQTIESSIFHLLHIDQRANAYDVDGMRIFFTPQMSPDPAPWRPAARARYLDRGKRPSAAEATWHNAKIGGGEKAEQIRCRPPRRRV